MGLIPGGGMDAAKDDGGGGGGREKVGIGAGGRVVPVVGRKVLETEASSSPGLSATCAFQAAQDLGP